MFIPITVADMALGLAEDCGRLAERFRALHGERGGVGDQATKLYRDFNRLVRKLPSSIRRDVDHSVLSDERDISRIADGLDQLQTKLALFALGSMPASARERLLHNSPLAPQRSVRPKARFLESLARILPAYERARYVDEALGNLRDCEHWWQRADHLVGLALGTPRLAWMMHRENRRG